MQKLPRWAIKPQHEKKVIATELGWVVESTGEVLVRVKNLHLLMDKLQQRTDIEQPKEEVDVEQPTKEVEVEVVETQPEPEVKQEEVKAPVKRRGRKKKATTK